MTINRAEASSCRDWKEVVAFHTEIAEPDKGRRRVAAPRCQPCDLVGRVGFDDVWSLLGE